MGDRWRIGFYLFLSQDLYLHFAGRLKDLPDPSLWELVDGTEHVVMDNASVLHQFKCLWQELFRRAHIAHQDPVCPMPTRKGPIIAQEWLYYLLQMIEFDILDQVAKSQWIDLAGNISAMVSPLQSSEAILRFSSIFPEENITLATSSL